MTVKKALKIKVGEDNVEKDVTELTDSELAENFWFICMTLDILVDSDVDIDKLKKVLEVYFLLEEEIINRFMKGVI